MSKISVTSDIIKASKDGIEAIEIAFQRRKQESKDPPRLPCVKRRAGYVLIGNTKIGLWMELPSEVTRFIENFSHDYEPFEFDFSWASARIGYHELLDCWMVKKPDVYVVYPDGTERTVPVMPGFWGEFKARFNRTEEELGGLLCAYHKDSDEGRRLYQLILEFTALNEDKTLKEGYDGPRQ